METETSGSVTHWLDGLKAGESVAAQALWNRYFGQLVAVARSRLKSLSQEADSEDVALSALRSVMLGVRADRYPNLNDRTGLWPLLVTITARKSAAKNVQLNRTPWPGCSFPPSSSTTSVCMRNVMKRGRRSTRWTAAGPKIDRRWTWK